MTSAKNRDLIDLIGDCLTEDEKAAYFREMMYCRSLSENDELLRVLRAMQFLTLLMERVPERVAEERNRIAKLLGEATAVLAKSLAANQTLSTQIQYHLGQMYVLLEKRISPETFVEQINQRLLFEFGRSTIPETSAALAKTHNEMKQASSEITDFVNLIGDEYRSAAEEARVAIEKMQRTISNAAETAKNEARNLVAELEPQRWLLVYAFVGLALVLGLFVGLFLHY
jgi:hypothetical protein